MKRLWQQKLTGPKTKLGTLTIGMPTSVHIEAMSPLLQPHVGDIGLDSDRFSQHYSQLGGAWVRNYQDSAWSFLIDICEGFNNLLADDPIIRRLQPRQVIGVIGSAAHVAGGATSLGDGDTKTYCLAVSAGATLAPYTLHARLSAMLDFLPEIRDGGTRYKVPMDAQTFLVLSDPRLKLASGLAHVSAYALLYQQLAHLLRGHVSLMRTQLTAVSVLATTTIPHDPLGEAIQAEAALYAGRLLAKSMLHAGSYDTVLGTSINDRLHRITIAICVAYLAAAMQGQADEWLKQVYIMLAGVLSMISTTPGNRMVLAESLLQPILQTMQQATFLQTTISSTNLKAWINHAETTMINMRKVLDPLRGKAT
ncbi:hypothetical protein [Chitinivorax sp. B]|uniref:hypothetical protein n=1 Tax=Chitinivorax sp. B TaxID=2502235 RepID=UPI0010F5876C|nr:hypothetical protein [Chitinivorax sp. B]